MKKECLNRKVWISITQPLLGQKLYISTHPCSHLRTCPVFTIPLPMLLPFYFFISFPFSVTTLGGSFFSPNAEWLRSVEVNEISQISKCTCNDFLGLQQCEYCFGFLITLPTSPLSYFFPSFPFSTSHYVFLHPHFSSKDNMSKKKNKYYNGWAVCIL